MDDKLRRYIDGLFNDVPQTKNVVELKEEMLQNLREKYEDLLQEGKSEEAAFNIAVAGIGDINELVNDMNKAKKIDASESNKQRSAMLTSVAVMVYVLSIVPILYFLGHPWSFFNGIIGFFIMIAIGTGILIYNSMTKPKYSKGDDTMVEEFKEWKTNRAEKRATRLSISVALWSILLALYFIISFSTYAWYVTWVIFVIGVAVEALINIFMAVKK
jgi:hypothetical protein